MSYAVLRSPQALSSLIHISDRPQSLAVSSNLTMPAPPLTGGRRLDRRGQPFGRGGPPAAREVPQEGTTGAAPQGNGEGVDTSSASRLGGNLFTYHICS